MKLNECIQFTKWVLRRGPHSSRALQQTKSSQTLRASAKDSLFFRTLMKVRWTLTNSRASTDDADIILAYRPISTQFPELDMSRLPLRTVDDAPDAAKKGLELAQKA